MSAAIVAVIGTLPGALLAGVFQHTSAGRAERAATAEQLRRGRLPQRPGEQRLNGVLV
ncbi:hypothetical protein [Streptomyces kanamyceticus]|uniref:hypothetical protein n=1 Tax=Streptomyces kanamyceticus TaxID=1967 RepID=UPI001471C98B|nr:hypothetical protein [Streptomyces kanamyceticus]